MTLTHATGPPRPCTLVLYVELLLRSMNSPHIRLLFLLLAWPCWGGDLRAQVEVSSSVGQTGYDTNYVVDMTRILTTRLFISTKINSFTIEDADSAKTLVHRPNNQVNMGFGASYRAFTLNIGIGFDFLNKDGSVKGTTDYFDAQGNMFGRKFVTNLFFQTYRGYYLDGYTRQQLGWTVATEQPFRGDIRQSNFGFTLLHIFNNERFSYRASFTQDAWQRRSAGSWLLGGYATYFGITADSSLVPGVLRTAFDTALHIRAGDFVDLGVMGGYAHTFVVDEHWFLTASYALGLGPVGYTKVIVGPEGERTVAQRSGGLHGQGRLALGYNGRSSWIGIGYNLENVVYSLGDTEQFGWNVGNFRFTVAHRFNTRIKPVDKVFDTIKG